MVVSLVYLAHFSFVSTLLIWVFQCDQVYLLLCYDFGHTDDSTVNTTHHCFVAGTKVLHIEGCVFTFKLLPRRHVYNTSKLEKKETAHICKNKKYYEMLNKPTVEISMSRMGWK